MKKPVESSPLLVHKETIYQKWQDSNGTEFYCPVKNIEKKDPVVRWSGGKIPFQSWVNICAFCELTSEEEKSECQFQLFYNDHTKTWTPWAFPQKKNTGMTTKELVEHPEFLKQMNEIRKDGSYNFGTLHDHHEANAFQSSTDASDEKMSEGIHITLGKISKTSSYDIHARFTAKKPGMMMEDGSVIDPEYVMLPVEWTDFIEAPDFIDMSRVPEALRKQILTSIFLRPDTSLAHKELLDVWKSNRIEVKPQHQTHKTSDKRRGGSPYFKDYRYNYPIGSSGNLERGEPFPDYEGSIYSSGAHSSSFNMLDPDVDEDLFKAIREEVTSPSGIEVLEVSSSADLTTELTEIIKDLINDMCEQAQTSATTISKFLTKFEKNDKEIEIEEWIDEKMTEICETVFDTHGTIVDQGVVLELLDELCDEIQGVREDDDVQTKIKKRKTFEAREKKLRHVKNK
jgi:hypothetical protein